MITAIKNLLTNEEGATAIEYGLIAALISVAIVGTLALIGPKLNSTFEVVNDNLPDGAEAEAPVAP